MERLLESVESALWGWPLLLLILGSGAYLSIRLRGLQFRRLPMALRLIFRSEKDGKGEISSFGALCTALSSTIGTGNIVGVATALALGGPGALLWMELSALTGMAVKYAEGLLAVKYRQTAADGTLSGGPFCYIEKGLGRRWRPMAKAFAAFGAIAGVFGVGTFVQINSITSGTEFYLSHNLPSVLPEIRLLGRSYSIVLVLLGLLLTALTGAIIAGGIRRISAASTVLVPLMAGIYLISCMWIILANRGALPDIVREILRGAFTPGAVGGGLSGGAIAALRAGISRGVFSNEAGLGSAPIAAAAARTNSSVKQGLVSMTATFFDTILICSITGLAVLATGANRLNITGTAMTMQAFADGLPLPVAISQAIVMLCLTLFAFTTVIGWNYYGVQCLGYLTGHNRKAHKLYQVVYVATVFLAPYVSVETVWMAANICNGLMAIPNLIGILLLSDEVCQETERCLDESAKDGIIS